MSVTNRVYAILEKTHQEGKLVSRPLTPSGDLIELSSSYPNSRPRFSYTLKNGRLHGVGRMWYENGQPEREDPFHKSILHGRQRSWYAHGALKAEMNYINNHLDGLRREWYPSGRPMMECRYVINRLDGLCTEWHQNGQVKERIPYWNGEAHGIIKSYDEKGRALAKEIYIQGLRYTGTIRRILNAKKINVKRLSRIGVPALRHFLLEEVGYERFLKEFPAQFIGQDGECELFKCFWHKDEEPLCLVKVKCPSTGIYYTLRVPPHVRSIQEAVAWTFTLEAVEYSPLEES